jgi:phosphatidate cytidylyltransferase
VLRTRILTALIGGPIVVLVLYFGGIPWLIGISVVSVLAWLEMDRLVGRPHLAPERLIGLAFILVALVEAYLTARGLLGVDLLLPTLTILLIVSLSLALFDLGERPIIGWSLAFGTALYLGILLSHFILLRERSNGFWWVFVAGGLTWLYDAGAYFVGSAFGKHKLWPRISPKKSWEGLIGATVITLIAGAVVAVVGPWQLDITWWQGLALGALIAVADPFGDFVVSLFKRQAQIKDAGTLLPGHGGFLDRLDSLMFTLPLAYYFALLVAGK